jgi:hypothetical protein
MKHRTLALDKFLARFRTNIVRFLGDADKGFRKKGRWPWAIVLFEKEYRLAGHVSTLRQSREDFSISAFSRTDRLLDVKSRIPPVAILYFNKKPALKAAAQQSELFGKAWEMLEDKPEERHWICIPHPPPEEWVKQFEASDDELYTRNMGTAKK